VNGHAPTEEKTQEEKDEFCDNLEHTLNKIPRSRIRIVLGDFNAKLGKENIFRSTVGIHSLHDVTSENGLGLIDFANGGGLIVKSTVFPHKDIYKGTWKAPNCRYVSQIDHVLINTRFKNCVHDVKTVRGADCDSDHYLVKGKLKVRLKNLISRKGTLVDRFDVNKLKDTKICGIFKQQLHETMNSLNINQEETILNGKC